MTAGNPRGRSGATATAALTMWAVLAMTTTVLARPPAFYLEHNGGFYHYVRESRTPFLALQANVESGYYVRRGIRTLVIYCPYRASGNWRGVPAIDHFSTNPENGSVEDFRALVNAAHDHGMAVVAYMGLLFVESRNPIWRKAQEDRARGEDTFEKNIFLWQGDPGFESKPPAQGDHKFSRLANAKYATSWGFPAINFGHEAGRQYAMSVLTFWLDLGVDGFEYDSPELTWGASEAHLRKIFVKHPNAHDDRAKLTIAEGETAEYRNERKNDAIGYSHQLLGEDVDSSSVATQAMDGGSLDALEQHFRRYLDARHRRGRGSKAVSTYTERDGKRRALEAAILAGNGAYLEIDYEEVYSRMDADSQARYDTVFRALASTPAEAPAATRRRLTIAGDATRQYAVLRTSKDGKRRALNVYNLATEPATIVVRLTGSGIRVGQTPIDLATGQAAPKVTSKHYAVQLPGLGFQFLEFRSGE